MSLLGTPAEALGSGESPMCHSPTVLQCGGLSGIGLVLAQRGREMCEVDSMILGASAHACGLIRPGDKLLSVNGRDVRSAWEEEGGRVKSVCANCAQTPTGPGKKISK
jgi:hypothetical protein